METPITQGAFDFLDRLMQGRILKREARNTGLAKQGLEGRYDFTAKQGEIDSQFFEGVGEDTEMIDARIDSALGIKDLANETSGRASFRQYDQARQSMTIALNGAATTANRSVSNAVDATARKSNLPGIKRGRSYHAGAVGRTVNPRMIAGPLLVAELAATVMSLNGRFASFGGVLGHGFLYSGAPWVLGAIVSIVVVAANTLAGHMVGAARAASRHAKADEGSSGGGGAGGAAALTMFVVLMLNAASLGLRISTDSGDTGGHALLAVLAIVSTILSLLLIAAEAVAYEPPAGMAVDNTYAGDNKTIVEFHDLEKRAQVELPNLLRENSIQENQYQLTLLKELLTAALGKSGVESRIHIRIAETNRAISQLRSQVFQFSPTDLEARAAMRYGLGSPIEPGYGRADFTPGRP